METPIMLTIPDAVRVSGISRSRLYELFKTDELVAYKAGRRTLISQTDLATYLSNLPTFRSRNNGGA